MSWKKNLQVEEITLYGGFQLKSQNIPSNKLTI